MNNLTRYPAQPTTRYPALLVSARASQHHCAETQHRLSTERTNVSPRNVAGWSVWRDGFVVVRGLIGAGQVSELLADYDRALRGETEVPRSATGGSRGRRYIYAVRRSTWFWSPERTMPTTDGVRYESVITIDNSCSSTLPDALSRPPESAPILIEPGEPVQLRIFVDRSVVEVFVNGWQCVAVRVYPGRPDSKGVSLISGGQESIVLSVDCWKMKNIYE